MDREQAANALLWPADQLLGLLVTALEKSGRFEAVSNSIMDGTRVSLRSLFQLQNHLDIEGLENVPTDGGVLFASNHQSWLDVQILGAAAPRRIHFIAKDEFRTWPGLRHLIRLSGSMYVNRGGDDDALAGITEGLRAGKSVAIFPEGTIPGEENVPRSAVDPETGLLRGRTGVARLAIAAGVPIVPVGISGTGRAFPPEVYPRLEVLRPPGNSRVLIRFGKPILPEAWASREPGRELYREVTNRVMHDIGALVDHRLDYPVRQPMPPLPRARKLGVLLLHGFTSDVATVEGLVPYLERAGLDYEMPVLRGHGTHHRDLKGVTAREWYVDAERALLDLAERVDKVAVVGLSMGGLVSLELAMRHPERIAGVVTVAAALRFADPLAGLTPLLSKLVPFWPSPKAFNDPSLAHRSRNYPMFATDAFGSLFAYAQEIESRLREVHVPIRVLHSKKDQVIAPVAANLIYENVSSPRREIVWFEKSGHEMMQDLEAERAFAEIMDFVERLGPSAAADRSGRGGLSEAS